MNMRSVGGKSPRVVWCIRRLQPLYRTVRIIDYKGICVWLCSDPGQVWDGWEKRHSIGGKQLSEGPRCEGGGHL